ncbi:helix-turn-helix domain-containing protein [Fructobacillus tropaeoli]|uniref:helix-turn-helix domain-containing protein n=1 Tax=Fructobacillus tropaeoli TaxID=709323 RepID=UPI001940B788|nr:helix-turn-helix transcriptional regulator [Fructobacillus tropaeoli]GIC70279.1 hypothetical protein FT12353_09260 [Fructobacillus tropaeoli]
MNKLKEFRLRRKETLDFVSEQTGINRSTLNRYENNKSEPKLATWQKLAKYYGVSIPYLQGLTEIEKVPTDFKPFDSTLSLETPIPEKLPKGTTANDIEMSQFVKLQGEKASELFKILLPKELQKEMDDDFPNYGLRTGYVMSMEQASNAFLATMTGSETPTKTAVDKLLYSILESVNDLNDDHNLNLENFIERLLELQKEFTSPKKYEDKQVPWN